MKRFATALLSILFLFLLLSCSDEDEGPVPQETNIIPERFGIDIPNSLTTGNAPSGRVANDELSGGAIYGALGHFIKLGEESADIVEEIIGGIRFLNITGITSVTYESDDDGRMKRLDVSDGTSYNGVTYQYQLLVTDVESESEADAGKAMQIFWNTDPIAGVAILKPYNIDRDENADAPETLFRIEYVDESDLGYDAHMIVTITNFPIDAENDPFGPDNLKMFVGKAGDIVDIYGNSNHPNASFITETTGFNWAFVASGHDGDEIGVAEVGLPPSDLNSTSRQEILETHSVREVFSNQILEAFPQAGQEIIDAFLDNTVAPGYFDSEGFVQGGESPGENWNEFENRIQSLTPFNPSAISSYSLEFQ